METITTPKQAASFYIGRCKTKGCATALRTDYRDVQNLTSEQYKSRDFDTAKGFMIYGVQPYGYCNEHGAYNLKFGKGRYSETHKCSNKCLNAVGPSCDCQCGGHNHGLGHAA